MANERGKIETLMQRIADDTLDMSKRVKAAYDLWNTANNATGATAILDLGYPGELLNIYDTLQFEGRESLKARMVGILCCLAANLPLEKAEQLYVYDVQSRLFELRCSTDPVKQPINALCGLINLLHHHGDHPMMHGDVQLYTLTAKAHKSTITREAFHGAYYSRWGLVRCVAHMAKLQANVEPMKEAGVVDEICAHALATLPQERLEVFVNKLIASLGLWVDLRNTFKTNLAKAAEYQATKARSTEAASYARLALFNHTFLQVSSGDKKVNRNKPLASDHILFMHQHTLPKELEKIDARSISTFERNASAWDDYEANIRKAKCVVVITDMEMQLCICSRCLIRYADQLNKPIIFLQLLPYYEPRDWILEMSAKRKFYRIRHNIEREEALMRRFNQIAIDSTEDFETTILEEAAANVTLETPSKLSGTLSVNVKATLDVMVASMMQQVDFTNQMAEARLDAIDQRLAGVENRLSKCEGTFARAMAKLQA